MQNPVDDESRKLNASVKSARTALQRSPRRTLERCKAFTDLAFCLRKRFGYTNSKKDLDEAIQHHRSVLKISVSTSYRTSYLKNLAFALQMRAEADDSEDPDAPEEASFRREKERENDLIECIQLNRTILELQPPGHPNHLRSLENLGSALQCKYQQSGKLEDLDEIILHDRACLEIPSPEYANRADLLHALALNLYNRSNMGGGKRNLEESIAVNRAALELRPPGHVNHADSLCNLAHALHALFWLQNRAEYVDEAVQLYRQVLELHPDGHVMHGSSLLNLAFALTTSFEVHGIKADQDEAIHLYRAALVIWPLGDSYHAQVLSDLAVALKTSFDNTGRTEEIREAVERAQICVSLRPPGDPQYAVSINNLAYVLYASWEHTSKSDELKEAVRLNREALQLARPGNILRRASLYNLGLALQASFAETGKMEDLDEAIECNRACLALRGLDHPYHGSAVNDLALALNERFHVTNRQQDLDEAIELHRHALEIRPPGHPHRATTLSNLAGALHWKFWETEEPDDLDEAIMFQRESLRIRNKEHTHSSGSYSSLASCLQTKYWLTGQMEYVEESVELERIALELCPEGNPIRVHVLTSLANALLHRWPVTGIKDLYEAAAWFASAEKSLAPLHPFQAQLKKSLATINLIQYQQDPTQKHLLASAFGYFESSVNHEPGSIRDRLQSGIRWVSVARSYGHESILRAYSACLALLNRIYVQHSTLESQHEVLLFDRDIPKSLVSDAAATAIELGDVGAAIEMLEQGRAVLWSKMRGYRHPLTAIRESHPELFIQFELLSAQLETYAMDSRSKDPGPKKKSGCDLSEAREREYRALDFGSKDLGPEKKSGRNLSEAQEREYRALSQQWNEVVDEIRKVEGFEDFMRVVPYSTLRQAAAEGPVIVINVSKYRSDAIIIFHTSDPILVQLSGASPRQLAELNSKFSDPRSLTFRSFSERLRPVLRILWVRIVSPVVDELQASGLTRLSRIWWCPTAEACGLPIHAAGPYLAKQYNLPDLFISSYTPTLSALVAARSGMTCKSTVPKLLVVSDPGGGTIPRVEEEVHRIRDLGEFVNVLAGKENNRDNVISGLQEHSWVHFACHGHRDTHPFHSSFQLYDGERLEILDLIQARLPDAELAFVSACHGAAVDIEGTPDEVIHLSAALQFSGFRSVVGTLWSMADVDGPDVAEDFYQHMLRDPHDVDFRDAAAALNIATRAMRRREGMSLGRWVNFVHIGA